MKTVVIGISSGIAAYKMLELIKRLIAEKINVEVIMTKHATQMLAPALIEKELGKPVHIDLYSADFNYETILKNRVVDHIALADKADVFVVAPATANTIGKLANGLADDFLTTTALAVTAPVIICPSMNVNMWNNPLVKKNVQILKNNGAYIIGPESGALACGYEGEGRLASIETIYSEVQKLLSQSSELKGKTVLVTAGGTSEPIDDVRNLTNKSTGKMGAAIAEAAYLKGANVVYVHAANAVALRYQVNNHTFTTADNLETILKKLVPEADIVIHAAAVSDFIAEKQQTKLSSDVEQTLKLSPRAKILSKLRSWNKKAFIVGFKAEHQSNNELLLQAATQKLKSADVDMIVANDISREDRGFAADTNEVIVVSHKNKPVPIQLDQKHIIAEKILDQIIETAFS